jgi:hypothetical protein
MVRTKIKRKGSKSVSNSSERLSDLDKDNKVTSMQRPTRSLDDMASMLMSRAPPTNNNGSTQGFQNQVFTNILQPQPFDDSSNDGSNDNFFLSRAANSAQSAQALQRSFIPNQIIMPSVLNADSTYGLNGMGRFPAQQQQQQPPLMRMRSAPTQDSRRMSLRLFEDLSRELTSNPAQSQNTTSDVSMAGSNASMHDNDQQDMIGDDLDHIFDDDIESIGEPVALDAASPFIKNNGPISADLAEGLLRSMFSSNA